MGFAQGNWEYGVRLEGDPFGGVTKECVGTDTRPARCRRGWTSLSWGCQLPNETWWTLTRTRSSNLISSGPSPILHRESQSSSIAMALRSCMNRWTHLATFFASFARVMGWGGLQKSLVGICRLHCLYPGHCRRNRHMHWIDIGQIKGAYLKTDGDTGATAL